MRSFFVPCLVFPLLLGCGADPAADDDVVVPEGKEDDFYSSSAKEYWVSGVSSVQIEETLANATAKQKLARAKELIQLKQVAIGWFLNAYLITKDDDSGNASYGGFGAMARFGSEEEDNIKATDGPTYKFNFKIQVGGSRQLIGRIPGTSTREGKKFTLALGRVSNDDLARLETNHEWYRDAPWSSFDPAKLSADQVENVEALIVPQKLSTDSWLAYDRLLADGVVTVAVHFGWDYWDRYDIKGSRTFFDSLVSQGFALPEGVKEYEDYLRTSGPLTKTIRSNKKEVVVQVWIFHPGNAAENVPGPDPDTDEGGRVLEEDMRDSLAHREVIVFSGHSGPLYGFALANWKKTDEGDFDDSDVAGAEMPSTYQIVMADGCDTYGMGQSFWANPAKADRQNLNVITTTSFSNAGTDASVEQLLRALTNQTSGKLIPTKISELAATLDRVQGWGFDTMFGFHGVDANPKYDPTSDAAALCRSCSKDADCGADGNRCTKLSRGKKACTFGCIDDTGCPSDYSCRPIASSTTGSIKTKQCVPRGLVCR